MKKIEGKVAKGGPVYETTGMYLSLLHRENA